MTNYDPANSKVIDITLVGYIHEAHTCAVKLLDISILNLHIWQSLLNEVQDTK